MKTTPIAMSVHRADESPVFGDGITQVSVEDEGAGQFIALRQFGEGLKNGEIHCDMDELEAIVKAARKLIRAQPKEGE